MGYMGCLSDREDDDLIEIPHRLILRKPKAYEPHEISLGLSHLRDSHFHFEDYVRKKEELLWNRFSYKVSHLNELVASITSQDNLSSIRQWYRIPDSEFQEPQKLGRMMALDGIFLLKFLREISPSDTEGSTSSSRPPALTQQQVLEDILKLQNQIPLFALKMIIQWEEQKEGEEKETLPQDKIPEEKETLPQDKIPEEKETLPQSIITEEKETLPQHIIQDTKQVLHIILKGAWHSLSPFGLEEPGIFPPENAHILGFVYENILGDVKDLTQYKGGGNKKQRLPEKAACLDRKGVKFAAYAGPLREIRFDRGTLHLPTIEINEGTDAVMRNLMAFELYGCIGGTPMKRYVELMDQLIDTAEDVEVLIRSGIVNHHLGTNQEVADIWNKMREGHDSKGKYGPIDSAINEVRNFYGTHRIWLSEGGKIFFSKPWQIVSFIVACIIVITAIVQTIFSGLQLHH